MFPLVEQYLEGEIKRQDFCEIHDLTLSTLYYWMDRYRKSKQGASASNFIQLEVEPISPNRYMMEVQTRKGSLFRFDRLVSRDYLKKLMEL